MNARSVVVYLLIVVLAAPAAMARQGQEPPEVWQAFAQKLEAGAFLQVRLKDGTKVKGHFIPSSGDTLRLRPKTRIPTAIRDFRFIDIDSIDRQRDGWSPGAKVLTGVSVVFGGILLLAAAIVASFD